MFNGSSDGTEFNISEIETDCEQKIKNVEEANKLIEIIESNETVTKLLINEKGKSTTILEKCEVSLAQIEERDNSLDSWTEYVFVFSGETLLWKCDVRSESVHCPNESWEYPLTEIGYIELQIDGESSHGIYYIDWTFD
ncbi:hypothetical protein [Halobacteriaceae bacterium SHR40]|uniref:hypothetical protein n=1 Tax=Halovenus amylolytica TaxID=2500550 RepID=UPI000FE4135A